MSDAAPVTQAEQETRPRGREGEHWPQEVRELAYQYWAFAAGRTATKVAAMLQADGHDVPARSVQYWASSGAWAERASRDLAAIAPDIRAQTVAELVYGALEAAKGLRSAVRGELPPETEDHIRRLDEARDDGTLNEEQYQRQLEQAHTRAERLLKTRVTAYLGMLDRGGFSPVGSNAPELPRVSVAQAALDFQRMTPEERLAWERDNRQGSALPAPKAKGKGHASRFGRGS